MVLKPLVNHGRFQLPTTLNWLNLAEFLVTTQSEISSHVSTEMLDFGVLSFFQIHRKSMLKMVPWHQGWPAIWHNTGTRLRNRWLPKVYPRFFTQPKHPLPSNHNKLSKVEVASPLLIFGSLFLFGQKTFLYVVWKIQDSRNTEPSIKHTITRYSTQVNKPCQVGSVFSTARPYPVNSLVSSRDMWIFFGRVANG